MQNQKPRLAVKISHIYTTRTTTKHNNAATGTKAPAVDTPNTIAPY